MVISDHMETKWGMNGQQFDSRSAWEADLKASGYALIDAKEEIKPPAVNERAQEESLVKDIKRSFEEVRSGNYRAVATPPLPSPTGVTPSV